MKLVVASLLLAISVTPQASSQAAEQGAGSVAARIKQALVDICPKVAAQGVSLTALATEAGAVSGNFELHRKSSKEFPQTSFTWADTPGVHLVDYSTGLAGSATQCGVVLAGGDAMKNGQRLTVVLRENEKSFEQGLSIVTLADGELFVSGDVKTSAFTVSTTINSRSKAGPVVISTMSWRKPAS